MIRIGLWIAILSTTASGQTIQLTGGGSSLFNSEGASARLMFATSETTLSGGVLAGHAYTGVTEKFSLHGWNVAAGSVQLPFDLATDFNASDFQFPSVGLLISHKSDAGKITLFTGATATTYQVPFFFGNKLATPTAGVFYERPLSPRWTFLSSDVISTEKQSAIQALRFKPVEHLTLAASGGIGSNEPFVALRAAYETYKLTGVIAWARRGPAFKRIVVPYYSVTENNGLEVRGVYNGSHFNAMIDRENMLSEIRGTAINSTINSASLGAHVSVISGSATGFYGTSAGKIVQGKTGGIGATVGPVTARYDVYSAAGQTSQSANFTEKMTRRFSVNQFVQAHSVSLGATYHGNVVTLAGGYSMSFLPALGTFQKVLSISLSIQLPHSLRLDAGTLSTPDGRTRWTAYGTTYQQGPLSDLNLGPEQHSTGKYIYIGRCTDEKGDPVSCAVKIGKESIYADAKGNFRLPSRKKKPQPIVVITDDFMTPGRWEVISSPTVITPEAPITVVLHRLPA